MGRENKRFTVRYSDAMIKLLNWKRKLGVYMHAGLI